MPEYRCLDNSFVGMGLGSLFQQAEFFNLHSAGQGSYFEWAEASRVVASIHFTDVGNGLWRSPARGTFAGFAFQSNLHIEDLFAFYDEVESSLRDQGAHNLEILPAPMAHDQVAFSNQFYLLNTRGYRMTHCDLNHSLAVNSLSLPERMTYGNQKRLNKCRREGLTAEQLPLSALSIVYETLASNRASKGLSMSMTLLQLRTMADAFPDNMVLFGCRDGEALAAAALCLRLSSSVMYVFYWGDRPGYASLSPVVAVADAIYSYCQAAGLSLLDIGISTKDSEPNYGLIQFKRGLGFVESLKVRMSKSL